jgi:glycerol-3-phosphate acyltransferase PlsY
MMVYLMVGLGVIISYLIGAIPAGYIAGKFLKGIDIRAHGSGNVGATNVLRVVGKLPALLVLSFDVFKGFFVVYFLSSFLGNYIADYNMIAIRSVLGLFVIAGHIWPVFLGFKGGKGVATSIGVFFALDARISLLILICWGIVLMITRYVSISSIIASLISPVLFLVFSRGLEIILFSSIIAFIIAYKHKENIKRLIEGTEKKIGEKAD